MPDFQRPRPADRRPAPQPPQRRPERPADGPGRWGNGAMNDHVDQQGAGQQQAPAQGAGQQQAAAPAAGGNQGALATAERTAVSSAAVAALPATVRDSTNVDLKTRVEAAVTAAAGGAFDACLAVAMRGAPAAAQGQVQEATQAQVTAARTAYDAGPGLAVGKFGQYLDELRGRAAATDAHVESALTRYVTRTARSVRVYTGIQQSENVELLNFHVSGVRDEANASENVEDIVEGEQIQRSDYGNAPGGAVEPNDTVLNAIITLQATYSFRITELAGGSHSRGSAHYPGDALDVDQINGAGVSSRNRSVATFMQACRDLGASLVLGPGSAGHDTHVHAEW